MQRKEVQHTPEIELVEVEMSEDENKALVQHEEKQVQQPQLRIFTCPNRHPKRYSFEFWSSFDFLIDDVESGSL